MNHTLVASALFKSATASVTVLRASAAASSGSTCLRLFEGGAVAAGVEGGMLAALPYGVRVALLLYGESDAAEASAAIRGTAGTARGDFPCQQHRVEGKDSEEVRAEEDPWCGRQSPPSFCLPPSLSLSLSA